MLPVILHPGEGKLEEWAKIHNPKAAQTTIPVTVAWELNERMYGDLQGIAGKTLKEIEGLSLTVLEEKPES